MEETQHEEHDEDRVRDATARQTQFGHRAIIANKRGTALAYCEARKSDKGDWGTIDILLRRSTDGGKTWGPRANIANVPGPKAKNPVALAQKLATPGEVTYNNPVAIAHATGGVTFLFCLEYARCFMMHSDDDGVT